MGLYNGSLDGVVGPETKQALLEFQESNVDQTLFAELAEASLLRLDHDPVLDKSRGNLPV